MISEQFTFDPSMKNITLTKGSKVTALGPLPEDWEVVRLGEVAEVRQGKTPKREEYDDYQGYRL